MAFDGEYDVVLCLQNGLSAMKGTRTTWWASMKALVPGGRAFFSTYARPVSGSGASNGSKSRPARGCWENWTWRTGDGKIVCSDGFTATFRRRTSRQWEKRPAALQPADG